MNKLLLFCLLLATSYLGHAQTDTVYFDHYWKKTDYDYAEYYRIRPLDPGNGYKIEDRFISNNKLQMSGHFATKDSEFKEGPFVFYNAKGKKESEVSYKDDKREGEVLTYYADTDALWYRAIFEHGFPTGELESYYKDGKIKRKEYRKAFSDPTNGKCYAEDGSEIAYTPFETQPKPNYNLSTYFSQSLKYPQKARVKNIEGSVIVHFVVNEDGSITDIGTRNSVSPEIDAEAIRVISKMPNWNPGILDGKPIKVQFNQRVTFKLTD